MPVYSAADPLPGPLSPKGIFKGALVIMHRIRDSRDHPLLCLFLAGSVWALWLLEAFGLDLVPSLNTWTTPQECVDCIQGQFTDLAGLRRAALSGARALFLSTGALTFVQALTMTLILEILGYTWELRVGTLRATLSAIVVTVSGFALMRLMDMYGISPCEEPLRYGRVEGALPMVFSLTVLLATQHIRVSSDMMPRELRLGFKIAPEWYCWLLFIISNFHLTGNGVSKIRHTRTFDIPFAVAIAIHLAAIRSIDSSYIFSMVNSWFDAWALRSTQAERNLWETKRFKGTAASQAPSSTGIGHRVLSFHVCHQTYFGSHLFYYIGGIAVLVLTFYVMNSAVFVFPHIGLVLLGMECYSALTTSKL
ncbi:hypothetical protein FOL47_002531 [Perkinsus chesapeaki]|uniref:Uncharacterized protein n=1 Tax=Perkinsus chesapeaki TaxID=330153 RepID=A0A7J6N093_PERCH|nr:hypothetical protein FOL47_002531 [Perkinsus chesapeaki]